MTKTPKHNFSFWGALRMRYCVFEDSSVARWMPFVWRENKHSLHPFVYLSVKARPAAIIPSKKQQARHLLTEPDWTRKDVKLKTYMRDWLFLIHPLGLFPHSDFHSKRLNPPKRFVFTPCERKRVKIWNKKNQMVNFQNGVDDERYFKAVLCLAVAAPSPVCHAIAHLFRRLPALATCGEPVGSLWGTWEQPS